MSYADAERCNLIYRNSVYRSALERLQGAGDYRFLSLAIDLRHGCRLTVAGTRDALRYWRWFLRARACGPYNPRPIPGGAR